MKLVLVFIALLCRVNGTIAQCDATFTHPAVSCQFNKVQFTFTGSAGQPKFEWNFGDAASGLANKDSIANPKHLYNTAGIFTVRLIISDTGGCKDTFINTIRILKKPSAAFTNTQPCLGLGTQFTSISTKDTFDRFQTYRWLFGDGGSDTIANPLHTYASYGSKNITFSIRTKYGCVDTLFVPLTIFDKITLTIDKDSACIADFITFAIGTGNTAASSYKWDFGDVSTSTTPNTSHQYNSSGKFIPVATIKYSNGATCAVPYKAIKIHPQPNAGFTILDSVQCFNYNSVCVKLKQSGPSLSFFSLSFDDGFVDYVSGYTDSIICHSYTDTSGGKYILSLSIRDKNQCAATSTASRKVTIFPKLEAGIKSTNVVGCFKTPFSATNTSNQKPPKINSFLWDFGDGSTDASNWTSVSHVYSTDGTFNIRLMIQNTDGCRDTFTDKGAVFNTSYVVDAIMDSALSLCRSSNIFQFRQTPISGGKIYWDFGNRDSSFIFNPDYHYPNVGTYFPKAFIDKNGCTKSVQLDTVFVYGPQALIGNIQNQYQCSVHDTVTLNNTSQYFRNRALKFFWDMGDIFAPACTTSTAKGLNVNGNCNFSTDSTNVRHMYSPGQDGCYFPRLIVTDTIVGCSDSFRARLPLIKPNAKKGLALVSKYNCLGPEKYKQLQLDLSLTKPGCAQQTYWVLWDSTCARSSTNFDSCWEYGKSTHNYGYSICDSSGKVSIGIVIQNGVDSNNVACTDTGWYHDILDFGRINPGFTSTFDPKKHYCKNSTFTFSITDTHQDSLSLVSWVWGDGSTSNVKSVAPIQHTFKNAGVYRVILYLELKNGCTANDTMMVTVGYLSTFGVTDNEICLGETVVVVPNIHYWNDVNLFWNDSNRRIAGLESMKWNLSDGKGLSNTSIKPVITYPAIGNYSIWLATVDSAGCRDTVFSPNAIRVFSIKASYTTIRDTFICAQLIAFKSNVTVYDSTQKFGHPDDRVVKYLWTFGTGLSNSILPNPTKYFKAGTYQVKLLAENTRKCRDSFTKSFTILGPTAGFKFVGDSSGCQALKVNFKNTSNFATAYTWSFGDPNNNSLFTTSDTGVYFNYPAYGTFYPKLTAQINIMFNGIPVTCRNTYPDTPFNGELRKVTVYENPKANFSHSTNCNNYQTTFTNASYCYTDSIISYQWNFGDGDTSLQKNPVHQFPDTGRYYVTLTSYSRLGCSGSIKKLVIVSPYPLAWFKKKDVCIGKAIQFADSTEAYNDQIAKWFWEFNDNTTGTVKNPLKTYGYDTIFHVKLTVTNFAGCSSVVTRDVKVYSRVKTNFSFTNHCFSEAIPLNNTSTTKENPVKYLWTLGNGDTSTARSLTKIYATPGDYMVKLKSTNWFGCEDSIIKQVTTYPLPVANFTINSHEECLVGNRFNFTDKSTIDTGSLYYNWAFGSYSYSTVKNPIQNYDSAGFFPIVMMARTVYNCRDTAYDSVLINPNPVSRLYTFFPLTQCINPNRFNFTDSSKILTGTYTFKWDLGDNTTSTNKTLLHTYKDTGSYLARLMTMSNKNCPDTLPIKIRVNPKPKADFTINNFIQCINGNKYVFTNTSKGYYGTTTSRWYFGDNDSSVSFIGTHSYTGFDTFTVKLIATNNTGCKDTTTKIAVVYTKPTTSFKLKDTLPCEVNNLFLFTNTCSIDYGTMTFTWNFGDNKSATTYNAAHSYDTFGTYPVSLIAVSNHGCRDTAILPATVFPMPMPGFGVNDQSQCINSQDFIFTNKTYIGNGSFSSLWVLGETDSARTLNARKQFKNVGLYKVVLHLNSNHNCSDSTNMIIRIHPKPYPAFSVNDSTQCVNSQQYIFFNLSKIQKGSLTYQWQMGNGTIFNSNAVVYQYPAHGNYKTTLTAYSDSGCVDSISKPMEVFPKPISNITANDSGQCVNANLFRFHGNYSIPYGTVNTYYWNLDGTYKKGTTDTFKNYKNFGQFNLSFIAESMEFCKDTSYLTITVHPKPKSLFTINDSAQCENDNLFAFNNKSTFAYGPLTYLWDFGNGTTDTFTHPKKIFSRHDTLLVTLVPFTLFDCRDTFSSTIIIFPKPNPAYTVNDSTQCLNGNKFIFKNTSKIPSGTMTYMWETGDGYSNTNLDTGHTYNFQGAYKVMLRALSSEGCRDSFWRFDTLYPKPNPVFSINKVKQCLNDQLYIYTNASNIPYGQLHYEWKFGDGLVSTNISPSHQYANFGLHAVQLKAISEKQCSDSISKDIRVFAKPMMKFTINDTDQCINTQNLQFKSTATIPQGGLIKHYWKFGDGGRDSGVNTAHYFRASDFYTITHTAISDSLCVDSVKRVIRIFPKPIAKFSVNDSAQCIRGNYYIFNEQSFDSSGLKIFHWDIHKIFTAYTQSVRYSFKDTGYKTIELITTSNNGCMDTASRSVYVKRMPVPSFTKLATYYCENTPMVNLIPDDPGGIFYGKNISGTYYNPQKLWNDTVKYIVTVNGCTDSSEQFTKVYPAPHVHLGKDTQLCLYEYIDLSAQSWNATYHWNTSGNDYPVLRVIQPGTYSVTATNICGKSSDTIKVSFRDINCRFFMPNAFSPNNDEINEYFRPATVNVPEMRMQIFNRWGEKIYDGNQDSPGWDGTYKGEPVPQDVYLWKVYCRYPVGEKSIELNEKGTFHLLR